MSSVQNQPIAPSAWSAELHRHSWDETAPFLNSNAERLSFLKSTVGLSKRPSGHATIDFETRSQLDVKKVGAAKYAEDPSTEILCLSYKIPGLPLNLWHPGLKDPPLDLLYWVSQGQDIEAHNCEFEFAIWNSIGVVRYNWPPLSLEQCFCSAAKAAAHALPRALEDLGPALDLAIKKDISGKRHMLKMSKPRKPTKNDQSLWHESFEDFDRLFEYNKTDVVTEELASKVIPSLSKSELDLWRKTVKINWRGIYCDTDLCKTAIEFLKKYEFACLEELRKLSSGTVQTAKQVANLLMLLELEGLKLENLQAMTVRENLARSDLNETCRRLLEIRQAVAKSSVSKFERMIKMAGRGQRIRGTLLYHGASTGRYCIPGDAEVLTRQGWTAIKDWNVETPIASWSPNCTIKFEQASAKHIFPGGEMLAVNKRTIRFCVTPEHRIPYYTSRKKLRLEFAKNLLTKRADIPLTGFFKVRETLPADMTRAYVMIQADGHYSSTKHGGEYLVLTFKKNRKIKRCRQILKNLKLNFRENKTKRGTLAFVLRRRHNPDWLWEFFNKKFGPFLFQHDLKVFIEEIPFWDGYRQSGLKSFEYSSCERNNAEWVQLVAHLTGYSARIVRRPRENKNWRPSYRVFVRPNVYARVNPSNFKITKLHGSVYCPELPSGMFLMKYKNSISITGNSGRGIQPQNFPRGTVKDIDTVFKTLELKDYEFFKSMYPDVFSTLSSALRGMLRAAPGNILYVGDFAAIEARVVLWLAGDDENLEVYREGKSDPYKIMAAKIFGVKYENVTKEQRELGKRAVLGCGYGMGPDKFKKTCYDNGGLEISEDLAKKAVEAYRDQYWAVKAFWYDLERAAMFPVQNPGRSMKFRGMHWYCKNDYLYCELPSGRRLAYYKPQVKDELKTWGVKATLSFMAVNPKTKKWARESTYGGALTENVTQATARDVLVNSMWKLDSKYPVILTVHDEIVCEVKEGQGSVEEFEKIMSEAPEWAKDLPIKVEAWSGVRYRK